MTPGEKAKPILAPDMSIEDFTSHYWLMSELQEFAEQLGLPRRGPKPELTEHIERRLRGLPDRPEKRPERAKGPRDSDSPLRLDTPVVNYKSDAKTRAFFKAHIGPEFHFTYHLNQYRRAHDNLTYGDLVDEWLKERERRRDSSYKPKIASQGEYNQYIRDFFEDERNARMTLRDAVASWNSVKNSPGSRRYKPRRK